MGGRVKVDSLSKTTGRPLVQKEETGAFRWLGGGGRVWGPGGGMKGPGGPGPGGRQGGQVEGAGLSKKVNNEIRREVSPCLEINGGHVVEVICCTE